MHLNLTGTEGEKIEVVWPGTINQHNGPDFKDAHIKVDGISCMGPLRSTLGLIGIDMGVSGMSTEAVVLHVVFEMIKWSTWQTKSIPTMALKGAIKPKLFDAIKHSLKIQL